MDRSQSRSIARDLRGQVDQLRMLMKLPDRAKADDFRVAAEVMLKAADSIDALIDADLPGCVCARVEDGDGHYLDYAESCRHHGALCRRVAELKKGYERAEKKLKDEVRMTILRAALSGSAASGDHPEVIVRSAIGIADEAVRQIVGDRR